MKSIALYGAQGAGKTTIAATLELMSKHWPIAYFRKSFADPIRQMVDIVAGDVPEIEKNTPIRELGGKSYRDLLKEIGMWGRGMNPDIWAGFVRQELITVTREPYRLAIDDLRFHNELNILRLQGVVIVKLSNPAAEYIQEAKLENHASEVDWKLWEPDIEVENDHTRPPEEVAQEILDLVQSKEVAGASKCTLYSG